MSSLAYAPPSLHDDDNDQEVLIQFDDSTFEPAIPNEENFEDQVREAQEQLAQLRHREEQLERQKRELEELHQKKAVFAEGRARLSEDLARAVSALDREADECQRRADQCHSTKEALEHYHRVVESLRPDHWSRTQLKEELSRGQSQLNEAEEELGSAASLLASIRGAKGRKAVKRSTGDSSDNEQGFLYWFKSGLAFTLPLMIFAAVFGLFYLIFGGA